MINPMGARVLVQRMDEPIPTTSTIIIPDTVKQELSDFAMVLAVGPKVQHGGFLPGDVVILKKYVGAPIYTKLSPLDVDETECSMVNEDDILAVVEGL